LLADPKRSAMMWALMDGSARQTEELALLAGLSPSSASAHLGRLSAGPVESRGPWTQAFSPGGSGNRSRHRSPGQCHDCQCAADVPDVFKRSTPINNPRRPSSLLRARFAMIIWAARWPPTCISGC
jgi:hypothetical protein